MNKQTVLDAINSLEVIEQQGGDDAYMLVQDTESNRKVLLDAGVTNEQIDSVANADAFCIVALAFSGYADGFEKGRFVLWGPIDDDLRYRVLNGEGTAIDAERLLRALEPELYGN